MGAASALVSPHFLAGFLALAAHPPGFVSKRIIPAGLPHIDTAAGASPRRWNEIAGKTVLTSNKSVLELEEYPAAAVVHGMIHASRFFA
ncbi:MAG TPA: hypothetical protein PKI62_15550 [bacterium]|nr:hypothetical protein [bacterium]